jgi:Ca-activated chloride channel homolog
MTRCLIACLAWLALQPPQPLFRAGVDLVRVDALVTADGTPVRGLTAADFDVRDNGIRQRVTAVSDVEAVQLGVVLDLSDSMSGERLELARRATADLLGALGTEDRFALVGFGDQVGLLARIGASVAEAITALQSFTAGGATAMLDGTYAGILAADRMAGPKLVLVITDGRNNASWLQAAAVIDAARRHEAVIYPVAVDPDRRMSTRENPAPFGSDAFLRQANDSVALLRHLSGQTGGRVIEARWDSSLTQVFQAILSEFRQRYVVTFVPEGVGVGDGWHDLEVRVKRRGATVRARTRYWAGRGN